MKFQALLYVKREIASEQGLLQWMEQEAAGCGIRCIEVGNDTLAPACVTVDMLRAAAVQHGVTLEDCLFIVTSEAEWEAAVQLGLAALPYVPAQHGTASHFDGAWIVVEGFDDVDYDFLNKCYQRAHNLPWEILTTERCFLREFALFDMDALFALYEQPGVTDYMEGLYAREEEERYERAYIENMYRYYGYGMWLVCKKETGEIIGRAGLEHRDYHGTAELEMGYLIAPSEQRKGYATEVCRALIEYARENLEFPRINCLIRADHLVSKQLAERLGFTFFEKMNINGTEMDRYIYCFLQKNRI
jgi:RimJ/RimL family protein N-acetyltransferase